MTTSAQPSSQPTGAACSENGIHREVIRTVKAKLPDMAHLFDLAEFFKIFGDSTRIAILWALSESEMCVCDLCVLLKMKQSAVSHQLKTLRQARVVKFRREGKNVFYSLDDEHIRQLLNFGMQHMQEITVPGFGVQGSGFRGL
jgi:ArsR family transcriptional regulator